LRQLRHQNSLAFHAGKHIIRMAAGGVRITACFADGAGFRGESLHLFIVLAKNLHNPSGDLFMTPRMASMASMFSRSAPSETVVKINPFSKASQRSRHSSRVPTAGGQAQEVPYLGHSVLQI